ncbi:hypothetical protein [Mesobacillus foraminis]|nr:hypothetical protein [Mesobacillus foraminis]
MREKYSPGTDADMAVDKLRLNAILTGSTGKMSMSIFIASWE